MCKVGEVFVRQARWEVELIMLAYTVLLITANSVFSCLSFLVCPFLFVYLFVFYCEWHEYMILIQS